VLLTLHAAAAAAVCLLQPGSPRAYNIPDRFNVEEDGAEPRVRQTVLQQHVEFFDYVSDLQLPACLVLR
jgi:hypothetical protein